MKVEMIAALGGFAIGVATMGWALSGRDDDRWAACRRQVEAEAERAGAAYRWALPGGGTRVEWIDRHKEWAAGHLRGWQEGEEFIRKQYQEARNEENQETIPAPPPTPAPDPVGAD